MNATSAGRLVQQGLQPAGLAAISLLTIGCFATLSIYSGNSSEFVAPFWSLLLVYVPYLLALAIGAGLLGLAMTARGCRRYKAMLSAIAILVWVQGSILVWDYGALDGRSIDWMSGTWRGAIDALVWIVVLAFAITAFERFGKLFILAAVATLPIQVVGTAATFLFSSVELGDAIDIDLDSAARDAAFSFSTSGNVVHIVMDGFQSDIFDAILAQDSDRDLRGVLRGFTFFPQNLGAYPYTQLTVPAFLSGKLHRNEIPIEAFVRDTLQGDTILNAARDAGFQIDVAAPIYLANVYGIGEVNHSYAITSSDHVSARDYILNDSARLIDLALFRVVPHFAKALVHRDHLWVFQGRIPSASYLQLQYFSDLTFLRQLAAQMTVSRAAPVYKLIHVMLSHRPTVSNEQCEYDGRRVLSRANVTTQARCGLLAVAEVLQRMQDLGIYDDSLIVLMGDHGAWVPVESLQNAADTAADVDALMVAMATPLLAVKPPGNGAAFQVSNAPTSVIDVAATVADLLGLDAEFAGVPVFQMDASTARTRSHITYGFGVNPAAEGYLFPMQEYRIGGSPYDAAAWRKGKRYVAGDRVGAD